MAGTLEAYSLDLASMRQSLHIALEHVLQHPGVQLDEVGLLGPSGQRLQAHAACACTQA